MGRISVAQEVLSSAAHSAGTGYTNVVNASTNEFAMVALEITAKSGTPWLDVTLQMSYTDPALGNPKWFAVYSETRITSTDLPGSGPWHFLGHPQTGFIGWLRVAYTVGGTTPSLTFSVNIFTK